MLSFDYLNVLSDPIVALYEKYTQSVINDIARRLAKMDMTATAAWQIQRLTQSGLVYADALDQLVIVTGRSERELRKLFRDAGVKTMRFDDAIYRAAGLKPLPLNLSPSMQNVLAAGLRKTGGLIKNLTMSTAIDAERIFTNAADLVYLQVTTGAFDYDTAIKQAVKTIADKGLSTISYPGGRRDRLAVAMRRTVLTGVSQTSGTLQITRMQEMGVNLIAVSAHVGARNQGVGPMNHESWQGGVYSYVGSSKEYPSLVEVTGYGTGEGLLGWNCRHSIYPFFDGISESAYKEAELESFADKMVTYNDEEMTVYEASQKQRAIERLIRKAKRQASALEAAGLDSSVPLVRVRKLQARMRDFIEQTGLRRQYARERNE